MRTLVEKRGSILPLPEALHSDFSIARGTNAGYSAGRNMKGSGRAVEGGCVEQMHVTPTDCSAMV